MLDAIAAPPYDRLTGQQWHRRSIRSVPAPTESRLRIHSSRRLRQALPWGPEFAVLEHFTQGIVV